MTLTANMNRIEMVNRLKEINLCDVLCVVVPTCDLNLLTTWQAERLLHLYDTIQNSRYEAQRIVRDA